MTYLLMHRVNGVDVPVTNIELLRKVQREWPLRVLKRAVKRVRGAWHALWCRDVVDKTQRIYDGLAARYSAASIEERNGMVPGITGVLTAPEPLRTDTGQEIYNVQDARS
jgi:hypothetical protein